MKYNKYSVYNKVHDLIQAAYDLTDCLARPEVEMTDKQAAHAVGLVSQAMDDLEMIRLAHESALVENRKET